MFMTWDPKERQSCGCCDVIEGCLHEPGCDMERCQFCLGQMISCGCHLRNFYPTYDMRAPNCGLPQEVFDNGLSEEQYKIWNALFDAKPRIPCMVDPLMCGRCGQMWPEFFMVDDWHDVIPAHIAGQILCRECYETVKSFVLDGRTRR